MQISGGEIVAQLHWIRLFGHLKPYWDKMALAIFAVLISMGFGLLFPLVVARLLDSVIRSNSYSSLNRWTLCLAGVLFGQATFSFGQSYLLSVVGEHLVYDLRTRLYSQFQSLSLDFFDGYRVGELVSRLSNDVTQIRTTLTSALASFLSQVATMIGAIVIAVIISPHLTLWILAVVSIVLLVSILFGHRIQKDSMLVQDELANSVITAEEALQGIRVVKSFGQEQHETWRFAAASETTLRASIRLAFRNSSFTAITMFLSLASVCVVVWYGGREVISRRVSFSMMTGLLMYTAMIGSSLAGLAGLYGQLRTALGGVRRVFQILDLKPSVVDKAEAATMSTVRGHITLENVSFHYQRDVPVIEAITLDIRVGETLALVGPSGAGKSTVFNLIPRFYDPTNGCVKIDGIDIREVTQRSLRSQMAIVPQETILFGGTIRENILYGRLEATEAEIVSAARTANAHEFIMELPEQYQTLVGDRGTKLSGGQRQRIAVARAILRDPRILLLDEATSSLDHESERLLQEAVSRVMRGRTTIIIAHRMSTIKAAHRIAVFHRRSITELGSHDELIRLNGLYTRLYKMQFRDSTEDCPSC